MVMATRELCAMLGISAEELHASGELRPRSMSAALESPGFLQQQQNSMLMRRNSEIVTPRSRASDSFVYRRRSRSIDEVSIFDLSNPCLASMLTACLQRTAMLASLTSIASP